MREEGQEKTGWKRGVVSKNKYGRYLIARELGKESKRFDSREANRKKDMPYHLVFM